MGYKFSFRSDLRAGRIVQMGYGLLNWGIWEGFGIQGVGLLATTSATT